MERERRRRPDRRNRCRGDDGPDGVAGATGATGTTGATAATGRWRARSAGPTGATGATGANGRDRRRRRDRHNRRDRRDGSAWYAGRPNGADWRTGATGATGAKGQNGVSGYQVVERSGTAPHASFITDYVGCPTGKLPISGDTYGTGPSPLAIQVVQSAIIGSTWGVVIQNTDPSVDQGYTLQAVCVTGELVVRTALRALPTTASVSRAVLIRRWLGHEQRSMAKALSRPTHRCVKAQDDDGPGSRARGTQEVGSDRTACAFRP